MTFTTDSERPTNWLKLQPSHPAMQTTDIKHWLSRNAPESYAELQELRKALYARRTHGRFYVKDCGHTRYGEEKFSIEGRISTLLIVSNRARHYLLRSLCRLLRGN